VGTEGTTKGTVRHVRPWFPYAAAGLALVGWGLGPLFVNAISATAPTIVLYRLWLFVPVTYAMARLSGGRLDARLLRTAVPTGLCFALSIVTGYASFRTTSIAAATLIPAVQPALVLLAAGLLMDERRTRREIGLAALAFAGIVAVVLAAASGSSSLEGDLYAVANLLTFAAFFLLSKHHRNRDVHAGSLLAATAVVAALAVTPWALASSDDLGAIGGMDWVYVLGLVFVSGLMGHGIMTWVHRYLDVTVTSTLTLANPVIATVGAWLVFDQVLNGIQIAGIVVTLVALGLIVRGQTRGNQLAAEAAFVGDLLDELVAPDDRSGPATGVR
jgi:drug/metabolite transporter (DMT)-like permease